MGMAALYGVGNANQKTLEIWHQEYLQNLQTALTDTYTHEFFFKTLSNQPDQIENIKTFRHDSGDPVQYIQLVCNFLEQHQKKSNDYTILFSDALTINQILNLSLACQKEDIHAAFGVGNSFTHLAT